MSVFDVSCRLVQTCNLSLCEKGKAEEDKEEKEKAWADGNGKNESIAGLLTEKLKDTCCPTVHKQNYKMIWEGFMRILDHWMIIIVIISRI